MISNHENSFILSEYGIVFQKTEESACAFTINLDGKDRFKIYFDHIYFYSFREVLEIELVNESSDISSFFIALKLNKSQADIFIDAIENIGIECHAVEFG